ncbi:MAG TPA: lactate utilization protein [Candidatus Paceibacterota bacterium]|nr:lactate utilization protein [Candidatus Paceibacterota bacterium]
MKSRDFIYPRLVLLGNPPCNYVQKYAIIISMNYETIPAAETVAKTAAALKERNFNPIIVNTKEEALEKVKSLIPAGVSVMNGSSTTLNQIGFVDYLKAGNTGWNNLHEAILAEKDPQKQAELRKQSILAQYFLISVHVITESGQLLIASASGSQLPSIVFSSDNVIIVASTNKIVPTLDDAFVRLKEYVYPLEDARMKSTGASGSVIGKILIYEREVMPTRKINIILVNEKLGY